MEERCDDMFQINSKRNDKMCTSLRMAEVNTQTEQAITHTTYTTHNNRQTSNLLNLWTPHLTNAFWPNLFNFIQTACVFRCCCCVFFAPFRFWSTVDIFHACHTLPQFDPFDPFVRGEMSKSHFLFIIHLYLLQHLTFVVVIVIVMIVVVVPVVAGLSTK